MVPYTRTSDFGELTLEGHNSTWKVRHKRRIILAVVIASIVLGLLVTTIVFAVKHNNVKSELMNATGNDSAATSPTASEMYVPTPTQKKSYDFCLTDQCNKYAEDVLATVDRSLNPCDDFYKYACNGWSRFIVILDQYARFTKVSYIEEDVDKKIRDLIERAPQASDPASYEQVRNHYKSCTDLASVYAKGKVQLRNLVDSLGGWPVLGTNPGGNWNPLTFDFEELCAKLQGQYDTDTFISVSVVPNDRNSTEYILKISPPDYVVLKKSTQRKKRHTFSSSLPLDSVSKDYRGITLPVTTYYEQWVMNHAAWELGANHTTAASDMYNVLQFENQLSDYAHSTEATFEVESLTTVADLKQDFNQINWQKFFQFAVPEDVRGSDKILIRNPSYLRSVNGWLSSQSKRVKANAMIWRLVRKMLPYLYEQLSPQSFVDIPRWRICVNEADKVFPHATGRMYVDEHFPADVRNKITEMVKNLKSAMSAIIGTTEWLEERDRRAAQEKLVRMEVAVGFPEWVKEDGKLDAFYSDLPVQNDTYFNNTLNYLKWVAHRKLARLRGPVDRSLWQDIKPTDVNAKYNYHFNGIVLAAGILQPPFYHPDLPWSSNYGGVGAVIGHEITHGFDNHGIQYDKGGNKREWLSNLTMEKFAVEAQRIVEQYSAFVVPDIGRNVNGEQTEAGNIADNGGLREAYKAYKDTMDLHSRIPDLEDFTDDQMFFLSYAQVSCGVRGTLAAKYIVDNDVHSPLRYRVIGSLQNNEDFSRAFNCTAGSYMNPHSKFKVW